jgi:hypothetical protein
MALVVGGFLSWWFLNLCGRAGGWSWNGFGFARLEKEVCPIHGAGVASSGIIF